MTRRVGANYVIRKAYQLPNGSLVGGWTQEPDVLTWTEATKRRAEIRMDVSNLDRGRLLITIEELDKVKKGDRVREPIKRVLARLRRNAA